MVDETQSPSVTGTAHTCIHEYVEGAFDDVVRILRANRALLGIERGRVEDQPRSDFVHHGMANVAVRVDGLDASLLVFRIVGGRQEPVTELVLAARAVHGSRFPAAAAEFVEALVAALEPELRAA